MLLLVTVYLICNGFNFGIKLFEQSELYERFQDSESFAWVRLVVPPSAEGRPLLAVSPLHLRHDKRSRNAQLLFAHLHLPIRQSASAS